jgi:hypothetical protein
MHKQEAVMQAYSPRDPLAIDTGFTEHRQDGQPGNEARHRVSFSQDVIISYVSSENDCQPAPQQVPSLVACITLGHPRHEDGWLAPNSGYGSRLQGSTPSLLERCAAAGQVDLLDPAPLRQVFVVLVSDIGRCSPTTRS